VKLDDAYDHMSSDELPDDVPEVAGATHIGMFVGWAIHARLWRAGGDDSEALSSVRQRKLSGRDFVLGQCDGKLFSEMLDGAGEAFAESYYPGKYLEDYRENLVGDLPSDYSVEDTWENFDRLSEVIDLRWAAFRSAIR
jgi:hypothetical protein